MNSKFTKLSFPLQPIPFQKGQQVPKKTVQEQLLSASSSEPDLSDALGWTGCRLHVPPGGSRHQHINHGPAMNGSQLAKTSLQIIGCNFSWDSWMGPVFLTLGPMVVLASSISWVYRIGRPMGFMHAPRCVGLLPSTVFSLLSVPFSSLSLSEIKSVIRNIIYNQTWWSSFHTHIV